MAPSAPPPTETTASGPDWTLHHGDALGVLAGVEAGSVDTLVCDPPAGIAMMGQSWDTFGGRGNANAALDRTEAQGRGPINAKNPAGKSTQPFGYSGSAPPKRGERQAFLDSLTPVFVGCLRVCRPGAVGLVWALPRTSHWTATALEDAGWAVEDRIAHVFGQGFPKHRSKLKPAVEDWWVCRKPGPKWLGVEECRIPAPGEQPSGSGDRRNGNVYAQDEWTRTQMANGGNATPAAGRWPANLLLSHVGGPDGCRPAGTRRARAAVGGSRGKGRTFQGLEAQPDVKHLGYAGPDGTEEVENLICHPECPVLALDRQAGERASGAAPPGGHRRTKGTGKGVYGGGEGLWAGAGEAGHLYGDSGNVSRFFATFPGEDTSRVFYCGKASRADRGEGNNHPCVKSVSLMSWLAKLACPAGGLVLDCFAGSGSTGLGCLNTGRRFLGIERDGHYFDIARNRLINARGPLFAAAGGAP